MELLLGWLVLAIIVAMVAASKGRNGLAWFLYGLAIWPIALVHILLVPRSAAVSDQQLLAGGEHRRCPYCAELIRREAVLCRHCGRESPPAAKVVKPPPAAPSESVRAPPLAAARLAFPPGTLVRLEDGAAGPVEGYDGGTLEVAVEGEMRRVHYHRVTPV